MQAYYCVSCRKKTEDVPGTESRGKTSKGSHYIRSKCSVCGKTKTRLVRAPHRGGCCGCAPADEGDETDGTRWAHGGAVVNDAINNLPFEAHMWDYSKIPPKKFSFCGPGTRLDKRLNSDDSWKDWSAPINSLDHGCYFHDLAYRDHKDVSNRNKADERLANVAEHLSKHAKTFSERTNAKLVKNIMRGKAKWKI